MGIYYRIWVDSITRLRSRESNKDNWQIKGMITMSVAMTFNFILLMAILQRNILGCYFYKLSIPFLSNIEDNVLTILVLFFLPCVLINYLLIFRGKKYEKLLGKYPYYNGKLFLGYFLVSLFLPIILLWIGIFLAK
jgi:hypothetical protein